MTVPIITGGGLAGSNVAGSYGISFSYYLASNKGFADYFNRKFVSGGGMNNPEVCFENALDEDTLQWVKDRARSELQYGGD